MPTNKAKFEEITKNIDKVISLSNEKIDLLKELKRALIHEYQKTITNAGTISFTKTELYNFKIIYNDAVKKDKTSFIYKDREFLTGFAKYVIEYLEQEL